MKLLMAVMLLAVAFCIVRAVFDFRARRYAWGALGLIAGLTLVVTPIPTQAVRFDLPVNTAG
jgi:hypothetical protein